jgi:L-iditol 2-dehydrogenase
VLVIGAGPVGLFAAQVARAFGAASVAITDLSEPRLAVAAALGLQVERPGSTEPRMVDVLLECSGSARALQAAFPRVDRAGRVVLIGMGQDEVLLPVSQIQSREIWVTGTFRYANTYPDALQLIASGAVLVDPVVSHTFPLARSEDALLAARTDPTALKSVVVLDVAES